MIFTVIMSIGLYLIQKVQKMASPSANNAQHFATESASKKGNFRQQFKHTSEE
jgi:hypothetical protein